jgi:hypothetical protein
MRNAFVFFILVWISTPSRATNYDDPVPNPSPPPVSELGTYSSAVSESASTATATGGNPSASAVGGDASSSVGDVSQNITVNNSLFGGADAVGSAGTQSQGSSSLVTINEAPNPDKIKIKNTPTAIAPDIYPTVSCFKTGSFAFSVPGFGGSAGAGKIDQDCVKREYIRLAYAMGLLDRATFMWCKQPSVWEDFGSEEACLLFEVEGEQTLPVVTYDDPEGGYELAGITEEEYREQQARIKNKSDQQQDLINLLRDREKKLAEQLRSVERLQERHLEWEDDKQKKLKALLEEEK